MAAAEDPVQSRMKGLFKELDPFITSYFAQSPPNASSMRPWSRRRPAQSESRHDPPCAPAPAPPRPAARQLDEDYGDDEDDEQAEDKSGPVNTAKGASWLPNGSVAPTRLSQNAAEGSPMYSSRSSSSDEGKSLDDMRKQLEAQKKAAEEEALRSFYNMFYTLEHDRDAMLEQLKLDELDRAVEKEISGAPEAANGQQPPVASQGTLGNSDLGASSLTLKHLIARIDEKRSLVQASDNQLRSLISVVRKGRSKWASEDRVGQEELYEAAEKVLIELKAMTEHAQPFLQRVNKRDAPDYFHVIKNPMDIGTMMKKLKQLAYRSKKEFVDDLQLIWSNCLKYNSSAEHPFRKKALYMRKETDKLTPLIPEIVIRSREEVEAEERKQHGLDADESDDDAPIMASRGRKAPQKGGKGAPATGRKAPAVNVEEAPSLTPDRGESLSKQAPSARCSLRPESEGRDVASNSFPTPPACGPDTPRVNGSVPDSFDSANLPQLQGVITEIEEDEEDTEFKTWKHVTKKDRAMAAAERHRLFRGNQINPDASALMRTKSGMRRWVQQQKKLVSGPAGDVADGTEAEEATSTGETLAEGIEKDEESTLPDYYDPMSAIPELPSRWHWLTDSEGNVVPQDDRTLRMYPRDLFKPPQSLVTKRLAANMRQMQETRKICSKISVVKQMQLQGQTYQNQFQKYNPEPFADQDVGPVVVSEEGAPVAPEVCRALLQKSVAKLFFHAGFEDCQASAVEAATDIAADFMGNVMRSLKAYCEQSRHSSEQQVLHALHANGLDVESLESYIKDDVERTGTKLALVHERRPALGEQSGADGAGAFNDGSEQFVQGDFAEELGDDFFGFKELGLAAELGLETLSVPLHLLQNRMHNAYVAQHSGGPAVSSGETFPPPPPYAPITVDNVSSQIGIAQDWFRARLQAHRNEPLVEDEQLPTKQRFPKPRLPPNGKISSPRKRPLREQQQMAKKKRKLEEEAKTKLAAAKAATTQPPTTAAATQPTTSAFTTQSTMPALRLQLPKTTANAGDPAKNSKPTTLISPESIRGV
ncbi:hypothetical protein K470DRAFT_265182 [Piedraia hortae CBS 480.64]|uniref:SAGA complex subunit Spt7 n=1 Tax=Piedraia hortae CBS 480.64 TaxID=1314780 RepID=A0A6A7BY23_9PEZI|nr:hypothetical protein K470DRAFT_265182 [Piedraia hortae CBS 480.64]